MNRQDAHVLHGRQHNHFECGTPSKIRHQLHGQQFAHDLAESYQGGASHDRRDSHHTTECFDDSWHSLH